MKKIHIDHQRIAFGQTFHMNITASLTSIQPFNLPSMTISFTIATERRYEMYADKVKALFILN